MKNNLFRLIIGITAHIALMIILLGNSGGFCSDEPFLQVEGRIIKTRIENSSASMVIQKADGSRIELTALPYRDWTEEQIKMDIPGKARKIPGTEIPRLIDRYSMVKAWYLPEDNTLIKYSVVKRPSSLWAVIVFSSRDPQETQTQKYVTMTQGFESDIIDSSKIPGLKPGFYLLASGVFIDMDSAVYVLKTAHKKGWKNAYLKKLW